MLQRRLTLSVIALTGAVFVTACGGGDEIENAVVRPGITAIEEARSETCGVNAATLRTAIDAYTMLNAEAPADDRPEVGGPASDEAGWDDADEDPKCAIDTLHLDLGHREGRARARDWLAGTIDDAAAVARMAESYAALCNIWDKARATAMAAA